MINLVTDMNNAQETLAAAVRLYIKDKSVDLITRWDCAVAAKAILSGGEYMYHKLDHLVVGGEVSWYDSFNAERYSLVTVMDDDFLDHFVQCSTDNEPVFVYFEMDDWGMEDPVTPEVGVEYQTKQLDTNEYPESMYCNPVKLKPGATIDDLKEAILEAGDSTFLYDW
jgi:hypothetical protein